MSMYECAECGNDHATFAQVLMAVNTIDSVYPYHETEFEQKFNELWEPTGVEHYDPKGWEKFWSWLGDKKILWFCSKECAIKYLIKKGDDDAKDNTP